MYVVVRGRSGGVRRVKEHSKKLVLIRRPRMSTHTCTCRRCTCRRGEGMESCGGKKRERLEEGVTKKGRGRRRWSLQFRA